MKILRKLLNWILKSVENVDELAPKKEEERRTYIDRRKSSIGYEGKERRSGSERRAKSTSK